MMSVISRASLEIVDATFDSPTVIQYKTRAASSVLSPYSSPVAAMPDTIVTNPMGIVPRKSECVSWCSMAIKIRGER